MGWRAECCAQDLAAARRTRLLGELGGEDLLRVRGRVRGRGRGRGRGRVAPPTHHEAGGGGGDN